MPTALVTGGSSGIGLAICRELLDAGHAVISLDRKPHPLAGERLRAIIVDLADTEATAVAARDALAGGPITTLVHNAGLLREARLDTVTTDDLAALSQVHVTAAVVLAQALLPGMRAARFGRIVLIASRAVLGLAGRTAYAASKAAMLGLARSWALELGPEGITVNVVAPGPVETDMLFAVLPPGDPRIAALAQSVPMRRLGQPEDVARAVLFFADPANGFITGQTLFVCGGTSIGGLAL
ncbi:MAG: SDR family oxidoreductase [Alphaproteobacteria bacterium]|nr:SDR family oxidoreductase [Alphaproteobacteria bacterium]